MRDSIFRSAFRAFFIALFSIVGLAAGLSLALLAYAVISGADMMEAEQYFEPTVVANADDSRNVLSSTSPVILKINIDGVIGSEKLNMFTVRQLLIESRERLLKGGRVKALLLHINSPGGTVTDSDGIYRAIKAYKEKYNIPVFAYVDGMCASGGMYVAAAADVIYASEASIIGSVGVLLNPAFNFTKLMEKVGVESLTLTAGKGKDDLNPFRTWKPGEDDVYKSIIDNYYNQFVDIIVSNRADVTRSRLVTDYGAKVFPAEKALEYGLIDAVGFSLNDTISTLAKHIDIHDDYYQVVRMERAFTLGKLFQDNSMLAGKITHQLELPFVCNQNLVNQFLYLYTPGG